jgi:hypothetical protein
MFLVWILGNDNDQCKPVQFVDTVFVSEILRFRQYVVFHSDAQKLHVASAVFFSFWYGGLVRMVENYCVQHLHGCFYGNAQKCTN